jgi:WD40 repeat protein
MRQFSPSLADIPHTQNCLVRENRPCSLSNVSFFPLWKSAFKGLAVQVTSVCFGDGERRVAAASMNNEVCVWDVRTGEELRRLKLDPIGITLAFFPDGRRVLANDEEGKVSLWTSKAAVV